MADNEFHPASVPITGAGPRLKAAREAAGLTLAQISAQTRIPSRMLVLIEAGNFAGLPARTYATGFTRSYARAVGLNEDELANTVRRELGLGEQPALRQAPDFEPGDPARVPTARFAWLAALALLLVIAAGLVWWRTYYVPAATLPPLVPDTAATAAPPEGGLRSDLPLATMASGDAASMGPGAAEAPAAAPAAAGSNRDPRRPVREQPGAPPAASAAAIPLEAPVAASTP